MYSVQGSRTPTEVAEGEYALSLKDFVHVLWRHLLTVVLVTVLVVGAASGFSLMQTPVYEASAEVLVGQQQRDGGAPISLQSDVMGLQQLTQTVAAAVDSRVVAAAAVEKLDLQTTPNALLRDLKVEQVPNTQLIQITYRATDPEQARTVANTVAGISSEKITEISTGASGITANVWEPAVTPSVPVSPNPVRNGALALVLGLMLGVGVAFLLEYLDDSWRSTEEVEFISGVPTFGVIPKFEVPKMKQEGSLS